MKITVIMPMNGLGQRFLDAGFLRPKPLIKVDGKPMFMKALESFPSNLDIENIFVIRKNHDDQYHLAEMIKEKYSRAKIVVLESDTKGAVETCLKAESVINLDLPIIVADCDIRFISAEYITKIENNNADGLLVSFRSADPRYSYAAVENGKVLRTAEKIVISDHALLGGYYFSTGELFLKLAHEFMEKPLPKNLNEYYLSHLFNILLAKNGRVEIAEADSYDIWGTPEELRKYKEKDVLI